MRGGDGRQRASLKMKHEGSTTHPWAIGQPFFKVYAANPRFPVFESMACNRSYTHPARHAHWQCRQSLWQWGARLQGTPAGLIDMMLLSTAGTGRVLRIKAKDEWIAAETLDIASP